MFVNKLALLLVIGVALTIVPVSAEEGKVNENTIDIGKLTCKEMMGGNDTDREIVVAFFHGFMAGKKNVQVIDLPKASAISDWVKDYCLSNPTSTVMDAFKTCEK